MLLVCFALPFSAFGETYFHGAENINFDYGSLKLNTSSSKEKPLSIVFEAGASPFSISVLFKQEAEKALIEKFIAEEEDNQKRGGYEAEISINKFTSQKITAYELIRESPVGRINWYIFQPQKSSNIYSFWLLENVHLEDENQLAVRSYNLMKETLRVGQ